MEVNIDLRKYFPNHILETRGEDIDFLYILLINVRKKKSSLFY